MEGVSIFANISVGTNTATTLSEVDKYLNHPVENDLDPLKWWTNNYWVYPNLSSMALDYLSIPHKWFNPVPIYLLIIDPSNIDCSQMHLFPRPTHFALHLEPVITLIYLRLPMPWLLGMPWLCIHWWPSESHSVRFQEEARWGWWGCWGC